MRKLSLLLLIGAIVLFAPAANAQVYNSIEGAAVAGGTIRVTFGPFDIGTTAGATLFSDPVPLGNVTVNSQSRAIFDVQIPLHYRGVHHVEASGVLNGRPVKYSSPNFVVAAPSSNRTGALARSGSSNNTVTIAIAGAAAVVAGAGLTVVATRRRRGASGTAA